MKRARVYRFLPLLPPKLPCVYTLYHAGCIDPSSNDHRILDQLIHVFTRFARHRRIRFFHIGSILPKATLATLCTHRCNNTCKIQSSKGVIISVITGCILMHKMAKPMSWMAPRPSYQLHLPTEGITFTFLIRHHLRLPNFPLYPILLTKIRTYFSLSF